MMMFITTYNRLKAAEQKRLFDTIFTNGSFANMLDMHLHLAGRSFAHGATCFVALEADQIRALAGVLTKHTTKWGELCIPLLEMVPANEIILRALLDQIVRSLSALRPHSLKIGLSPHAVELGSVLRQLGFDLTDRALEYGRPVHTFDDEPPASGSGNTPSPARLQFVPLQICEPERFQRAYNRAFAHLPHMFPLDLEDAAEKKALAALDPDLSGIVRRGESDAALYELEEKEGCGWIETIAVLPEYRRSDIGSAIVRYALDIFRRRCLSDVRLRVYESNRAARSFYERHRFEQCGVHSHWYTRSIDSTSKTSSSPGIRRGRKVRRT